MPQLPLKWEEQPNSPPPAIEGRWFYPYIRLSCANIDVKTTAEGRYEKYFAAASGFASHHVFEFSATHPVLGVDPSGDAHAYGRWLIGTLGATKASANFSAAVAAATTTGSSATSSNTFRGRARGIHDSDWEKLRLLTSKLDADSIQNLGNALAEPLEWCLEAKNLSKPPVGVFLVSPARYDVAASAAFALNRIQRGATLDQAREFLNDALVAHARRADYIGIDVLTVAAMYHRLQVVGTPTSVQKQLAEYVLKDKAQLPPVNHAVRGFWYNVPPYRMPNGAAPGFERVAPAAPRRVAINDWPRPASAFGLPSADTGGYTIDVETALRLGMSSLSDISAGTDAKFYGYGFASTYVCPAVSDTVFLQEKYTAGFRVRIRSVAGNADLGVAAIAAKATVAATEVAYEIEALGFDIGALPSLPSFVVASVGRFDVNTMNALGLLYQQASDVLSGHDAEWVPVLTAVEVNLGAPELQALTSGVTPLIDRGDARLSLGAVV